MRKKTSIQCILEVSHYSYRRISNSNKFIKSTATRITRPHREFKAHMEAKTIGRMTKKTYTITTIMQTSRYQIDINVVVLNAFMHIEINYNVSFI